MLFSRVFSSLLLASATSAVRSIHFDQQVGNFSDFFSLYYCAYSEKDNVLYTSGGYGGTYLLAINPDTLQVVNSIKPGGVGSISIDDENGFVWVADINRASVSYYKEGKLNRGAQYPKNIVQQVGNIYVNPKSQLLYYGGIYSDVIAVFSPNKTDGAQNIINMTTTDTPFTGGGGIVANKAGDTLYAMSYVNNMVVSVDLNSNKVSNTYVLDDAAYTVSSIALDSERSMLYIANKNSNNVTVFDITAGRPVKQVSLPNAPNNICYDSLYDIVYAGYMGGVTVIDGSDHSIITNLDGLYPIHTTLGVDGSLFVTSPVNGSWLYKFTPHNTTSNTSSVADPSITAAKKVNSGNHLFASVGLAAVGVAVLFL